MRARSWEELERREDELIEGLERDSSAKGAGRSADEGPHHSPFPDWRRRCDTPDRIGLALSGGGIRSATFNLGLLQHLDRLGLLKGFDYLATVSGGGYIGGFWSAWLSRRSDDCPSEMFPAPKTGENDLEKNRRRVDPEAREVRHLRAFSNFLRPRLAPLSFSTGRLVAGMVSAVLPSLVLAVAALTLILGVALLLGRFFLSDHPPLAGSLASLLPGDERLWLPTTAGLWMFSGTSLALLVVEGVWMRRSPELDRVVAKYTYRSWSLAASVGAGLTWFLLWHIVPLPYSFLFRPANAPFLQLHFALAWIPALAWGGMAIVTVLVRVVFSRSAARYRNSEGDIRARARQASLGRVLSRLLYLAAFWTLFAAIWVFGQWISAVGARGVVAAVSTSFVGGGAFAWARRLFSAQPNKPKGEGFAAALRPILPKAIAMLTVGAGAAATASLLILAQSTFGDSGPMALFALAIVVTVGACFLFEPHQNGFHSLYRARLSRAYLGASRPPEEGEEKDRERPFLTEETPTDDVKLCCLPKRPLHLVCCTSNDLDADGLRTLHRGAESAVLSKLGLQVGDRWREWGSVGEEAVAPTLSHAVTASAAAFNSQMGGISMRLGGAATFLLAALGLRLGLWLEAPAETVRARSVNWAKVQRWLPGLLFYRELFGLSRSRSAWVHLSDGAHFENLAFYELVRRHCRYILMSDCGADPDVAFDDFGNAVRRVREDFGVEVEIDLGGLRKESEVRQPMVAGDIKYPDGDCGILLYMKPTLVGDEPEDITQYSKRNRDFPHETTLDQFYDEAQWEAYRRLGEHIADKALSKLDDSVARPASKDRRLHAIRFFLEARMAWPPVRRDDVNVLASLDREWVALEQSVVSLDTELRRELFPGAFEAKANVGSQDGVAAHQLAKVQEALRLMQAVFSRSGIADHSEALSHPRYQGWQNRFGRWAATSAFRAWWPWLYPLHDRGLVEFLQAHFKLPASKRHEVEVGRPEGGRSLLALGQRPDASGGSGLVSGDVGRYGCWAPVGFDRQKVMVGVVDVFEHGNRAVIDPTSFFVPIGFRNIGIGESFLDQLVETLVRAARFDEIWVETKDKKLVFDYSSDLSALYTGAGFVREVDSDYGGEGGLRPRQSFVLRPFRMEISSGAEFEAVAAKIAQLDGERPIEFEGFTPAERASVIAKSKIGALSALAAFELLKEQSYHRDRRSLRYEVKKTGDAYRLVSNGPTSMERTSPDRSGRHRN